MTQHFYWFVFFGTFQVFSAFCQQHNTLNGVYLNHNAFKQDILTKPHTIDSLNFIFVDWEGDLTLVRNGHHTEISIDSIFGYRSGDLTFRTYTKSTTVFQDRGYYKLEDEGVIIIYSRRGWRDTAHSVFYYYSLTIDSEIIHLNRRNLRKLFRHEHLSRNLRKNRSRLFDREGIHLVINNILRDPPIVTD